MNYPYLFFKKEFGRKALPTPEKYFIILYLSDNQQNNKEEKDYDLETSEFLSPSLFCNVSKTTYLTLQR